MHLSNITGDALKLRMPFGGMIVGPQQTGKTHLMKRFCKQRHELFDPPPKSCIYAYGEYDDDVHEFQDDGCIVVAGVPSKELINNCEKPCLIFLDDLMGSIKPAYLNDLYTKVIHHQNLGVLYNSQDMFDKVSRVARINSQYIFLMRAPNAILQIRNFGQQLFPRQLDYFLSAYNEATSEEYGYLLTDLHPRTPSYLKLRTKIFPDDEERLVFLPKS